MSSSTLSSPRNTTSSSEDGQEEPEEEEETGDDTIHLSTPGRDLGHFSTLEVRPRSTSPRISLTSRAIAFPQDNYTAPPNLAAGFSMLDLAIPSHHDGLRNGSISSTTSHKSHDAKQVAGDEDAGDLAVRANIVGSDITADGFRIGIETWASGIMRAASATWIEHAAGAKECHFGQIDTMDDDDADVDASSRASSPTPSPLSSQSINAAGRICTRKIKFPIAFAETPTVVCWINRLDLQAGKGMRFRLAATCSNISRHGALVSVGGWHSRKATDTTPTPNVNGAGMCWIAFPTHKRFVDSGRIATSSPSHTSDTTPSAEQDSESNHTSPDTQQQSQLNSSSTRCHRRRGRTHFKPGWFTSPPTVLAALDTIDLRGDADLRISVRVEHVTREGFAWRIDTWGKSTLYAASASWIALGFE